MKVTVLPGTTIEINAQRYVSAKAVLEPMFMGGGLVLSQVSSITGLEPHMVQNWVKRGFVSSPVAKKYSMNQFCRIVFINFLKESLQIDKIVRFMSYINGKLNEESDDIVGDFELYCYLVDSVMNMSETDAFNSELVHKAATAATKNYAEPYAGAQNKLIKALEIMILLYVSSKTKKEAEIKLCGLGGDLI